MQGRKASSVMLLLFDRFVFPSGGFPRGALGFEALGCKLVAPPPKAQTWWVSIPAGLSVHFKWFHVCSTIVLLGICEANMGICMFIYIDKVESLGLCQTLGVEERQIVYFVILCLGSVLWVSIPPTKCLVNLNNSRSQYCFSYLDLNLTSFLVTSAQHVPMEVDAMDALSSMDGKSIEVGRFHDGLPGGDPGCHQVAVAQTNTFCIHQHSKIKKGESRET